MPSMARGLTSARQDGREAPLERLAIAELDERQLQQGALPGQVVEPRAGHLAPRLHVDGAEDLPEFEVILRGEPFGGEVAGRPDLLQHDEVVFAALGDAGDDEVADLADQVVEGDVGGPGPAAACLTWADSSLVRASRSAFSLPGRWDA